MTLMDVLVDFSVTGQVGPLKCGMSLADAEKILGPGHPHPAIRMFGPDIDGYPYAWGGLDLVVSKRSVTGIWIRLRAGSTAHLPPLILHDSESYSASVTREELIEALDSADCLHDVNNTLTFGNQFSILTHPGEVCAVFFPPTRDNHVTDRDSLYLGAIHKHTA